LKLIDLRLGIGRNKPELCVVLVLDAEELVDGRFEIKAILTVLDTWDFLVSDDAIYRFPVNMIFGHDLLDHTVILGILHPRITGKVHM
jgi:hypothetical protein